MDNEEKHNEEEGAAKSLPSYPQLEVIDKINNQEKRIESPINLNIAYMKEIKLPELKWHHHTLPSKKMKVTNTGHTVILSAKWYQERPFITGGPLMGNYVFSQMHFHWGSTDMEGSEHTIDGVQYPCEMHVVHFKSSYLTQQAALGEKDGVMVLVYFFKLQSQSNPLMEPLTNSLSVIQKPYTSIKLPPYPLSFFLRAFTSDYFMYWGSLKTSSSLHRILWIVCREPVGISAHQMESFRNLMDSDNEQLTRNFRTVQSHIKKHIYHVNPSNDKQSTLLPIPTKDDKTHGRYHRRSPKTQGHRNGGEQLIPDPEDIIRPKNNRNDE